MLFLKLLNDVVSFLTELVMLWLLGVGGFNIVKTAAIARWGLALLLPLIAIAIWGVFLAPNSTQRLNQPWLALAQIILFTIAALVAYRFTNRWVIYLFIGLGYASSLLALWLKQ